MPTIAVFQLYCGVTEKRKFKQWWSLVNNSTNINKTNKHLSSYIELKQRQQQTVLEIQLVVVRLIYPV